MPLGKCLFSIKFIPIIASLSWHLNIMAQRTGRSNNSICQHCRQCIVERIALFVHHAVDGVGNDCGLHFRVVFTENAEHGRDIEVGHDIFLPPDTADRLAGDWKPTPSK
jgi:hypothetical protein